MSRTMEDSGSRPANGDQSDLVEIRQVVMAYVWAVHASNWEGLRALFMHDVVYEAAWAGRLEGVDNVVRAFSHHGNSWPVRQDLGSSYASVNDDDTSFFTSYLMSFSVCPRSRQVDFYQGVGSSIFYLQRLAGAWKLSRVEVQSSAEPFAPKLIQMASAPKNIPLEQTIGNLRTTYGSRSTLLPAHQQVHDLFANVIRYADAMMLSAVRRLITPDVSATIGELRVSGRTAVARALCTAERIPWRLTFLTNAKVAVSGDTAQFGGYLYINAEDKDGVSQSGGLLTAAARRAGGAWCVSKYAYVPLWGQGQKMVSDQAAATKGYASINELWSFDEPRDSFSDDEEVSELMTRYTWAIDMNDFRHLTEIFHSNVEGTIQVSRPISYAGRDNLIEAIRNVRSALEFSQHYLFNLDTAISSDRNSATLRCHAQTRFLDVEGREVMSGGVYRMQARRTSGRWLFTRFHYERDDRLTSS